MNMAYADLLPGEMRRKLAQKIAESETAREQAIDVMTILQGHFGYMSDEAMLAASELLAMTPLELEELATFYNFIYRQPVGEHVIHVCDSAICWMHGHESLLDHLLSRLEIRLGETTEDGLFTVLPVCCLGYCDHAPAMLVDRRIHGELTREKIDRILTKLIEESHSLPGRK